VNVVSHYPNVPLNLANPPTQVAERENLRRELVIQTTQTEAYPRERPIAQEGEQLRQKELPRQRLAQDAQSRNGEQSEESATAGVLAGEEEVEQTGSEQQQEDKQRQEAQQQAEQQTEQIEQQQIQELASRDREVKTHEQAHAAVGGQYAGSPSYEYQQGPDGRRYAVGGEVPIDVSKVAGDPQATLDKMNQVRAAALAPAEPSSQDRRVAAQASATAAEARRELAESQPSVDEETEEDESSSPLSVKGSSEQAEEPAENNSLSLQIQQRSRVIAGVYYTSSIPSLRSSFRASA